VADTLSCLDIEEDLDPIVHHEELFGLSKEEIPYALPSHAYPLKFSLISKHQQNDKNLSTLLQNPFYSLKAFSGGKKTYKLICWKNKIVISLSLQEHITQWYHTYLCHPGETRTEKTISQHFTWTYLRTTVKNICQTCPTCQKTKKIKKYGLIPEKEAEAIPWEKLCVDLIGPYKITNKNNNQELTLWCLTMIDPATGWVEIKKTKIRMH